MHAVTPCSVMTRPWRDVTAGSRCSREHHACDHAAGACQAVADWRGEASPRAGLAGARLSRSHTPAGHNNTRLVWGKTFIRQTYSAHARRAVIGPRVQSVPNNSNGIFVTHQ